MICLYALKLDIPQLQKHQIQGIPNIVALQRHGISMAFRKHSLLGLDDCLSLETTITSHPYIVAYNVMVLQAT